LRLCGKFVFRDLLPALKNPAQNDCENNQPDSENQHTERFGQKAEQIPVDLR
jgi:hypothetical protein